MRVRQDLYTLGKALERMYGQVRSSSPLVAWQVEALHTRFQVMYKLARDVHRHEEGEAGQVLGGRRRCKWVCWGPGDLRGCAVGKAWRPGLLMGGKVLFDLIECFCLLLGSCVQSRCTLSSASMRACVRRCSAKTPVCLCCGAGAGWQGLSNRMGQLQVLGWRWK